MLAKQSLEAAQEIVYSAMAPTPQYAWPLLAEAAGCTVIAKHENHTPTGAFKVRGGLVHMRRLAEAGERQGVITATRGNHGQSIPFAGAREGIASTVLVPHGNSREKNAAMRAWGATLIEHGADFDEARLEAGRIAAERGLSFIGPFNENIVQGVSTCPAELHRAFPDVDVIYVPIGCGSGICANILVRDLVGSRADVVGVVAEGADAYAQSFAAHRTIETAAAQTVADGCAVRVPVPEALDIIWKGAARVITVSDDEIREAIRLIYRATHNVAEGAGAIALAGLMSERDRLAGKTAAFILCGGNIDTDLFAAILRKQ